MYDMVRCAQQLRKLDHEGTRAELVCALVSTIVSQLLISIVTKKMYIQLERKSTSVIDQNMKEIKIFFKWLHTSNLLLLFIRKGISASDFCYFVYKVLCISTTVATRPPK